jgi:hypothetical protein
MPTEPPLFKNGDILVGNGDGEGMFQYDGKTHDLIRVFPGVDYTGAWLSPWGHLWLAFWRTQRIQCWDMYGNVLWERSSPGRPETIAFDRIGYGYIGVVDDGPFGLHEGHLEKYQLDGTFIGSYTTEYEDRGMDHIEMSSDGHTLFYTSEGRKILRWDTKTSTQGTTFTTFTGSPTPSFYALRRVATDGSWVVANGPGPSGVYRFNSNGSFMRAYTVPGSGFFGMDIETDGLHFWVATFLPSGHGGACKVNLASGAVVATVTTAATYPTSIVNVIKAKTPMLKVS